MRFSVWPNPQQPWESILEVSRHAEASGWDGIWFADHFMPNADAEPGKPATDPVLECWAVLAALAVAVPRVGLEGVGKREAVPSGRLGGAGGVEDGVPRLLRFGPHGEAHRSVP